MVLYEKAPPTNECKRGGCSTASRFGAKKLVVNGRDLERGFTHLVRVDHDLSGGIDGPDGYAGCVAVDHIDDADIARLAGGEQELGHGQADFAVACGDGLLYGARYGQVDDFDTYQSDLRLRVVVVIECASHRGEDETEDSAHCNQTDCGDQHECQDVLHIGICVVAVLGGRLVWLGLSRTGH